MKILKKLSKSWAFSEHLRVFDVSVKSLIVCIHNSDGILKMLSSHPALKGGKFSGAAGVPGSKHVEAASGLNGLK